MKRTAWLAIVVLALVSTFVIAEHKPTVLDGSSWKVEVEPDEMTRKMGEKQFTDTLTFAEGRVSMTEHGKAGFHASSYTATKAGEKDWNVTTEQYSDAQGKAVWTGKVHGNNIEGKMILTKTDGTVLTYTFKGDKQD